MENKITRKKTEAVCDSQIQHMSAWISNYIKVNHERLSGEGIAPMEILTEYQHSVKFPVGKKAFAPMLYQYGLEKIRKGNGYVYVLFV